MDRYCNDCKVHYPIERFYKSGRGYRSYCIDCTKRQVTKDYLDRRLAVLDAMGGKCVRCGFNDWRALQIDHVHGGGTAEFKKLHPGGRRYFAKVLANPDDYQLLCANCNQIKKVEQQEVRVGAR